MKTRSIIGFAVAATVGGTAALSWTLSIWLAFRGVPPEATGLGPTITSEFDRIDQTNRIVCGEDLGGQIAAERASPPSRTSARPASRTSRRCSMSARHGIRGEQTRPPKPFHPGVESLHVVSKA
jgi:hypothetical protein